ncbi:hypothetical protein, partial [Yoonia sp.]|uniref:hypothetical protein n=1 Tax=Yoonia sp. TaxID=2212373 RepID=UPI0025EDAA61
MFAAGRTLLDRSQHPVVPGAMPPAIDRGGMQAGPTGHGGTATVVAGSMVIAEPTLKPCGVLADPRGRMLGEDDPASLVQQT